MKQRSQSWLNILNKSMLYSVILLIIYLEAVNSQFLVKTLPGFVGDLPFTLETGYIGVGESDEVQLFYYFIESEGNPRDDPLMVWMNGGPGCSALSGLLYEIGPFTFNYVDSTLEKPKLAINPHSWTKAANIISIDHPAGTGYSYAKTPGAYMTNDTSSTMQVYNFLRKWLVDHPKFLNNPMYIGGCSYSGIVVPMIVEEIYNGNEERKEPRINIKGYVLGNPFTNTSSDCNAKIPFAHRMGLISDAIYKSTKENCGGEYVNVDPNNSLCVHDLQVVEKCLARINQPQILEPCCVTPDNFKSDLLRRGLKAPENDTLDMWSLPQLQIQGCRDDHYPYSSVWANSKDVREALHIREELGNIVWERCKTFIRNHGEEAIYTRNVPSSVGYHRRLSDKDCRALVYSGDHDLVIPYMGTLKWIESLNLSVVDDWRPWFVDEQVAGYTMKYSKDEYSLTYATVKGGGHTAPEYKPKECLSMLMRWLAKETM